MLTTWIAATLLCLIQMVAALPWLSRIDPEAFGNLLRRWTTYAFAVGGLLISGAGLALFLNIVKNPTVLEWWGRVYGCILHAQLTVDFFVIAFGLLLWAWPRGGAVALAAFREGVRQPLFWLLVGAAALLLVASLIVPYFTMSPEDEVKMVKQLGYDTVMLAAVAFGVIAASMSIAEEIEGRTAITLMSKPVSRRQFLVGKYVGILLAALAMVSITGWCLDWTLYAKPWLERLDQSAPGWLNRMVQSILPPGVAASFVAGAADWFAEAIAASAGVVVGFGQVMVLLALAVALATRLPMMVTLVLCLVLYFLGHLAPVLVQASEQRLELFARDNPGQGSATLELVHFLARLVDTLLPALEFVNMGPAVVRDTPLEPIPFALYVASVFGYYLIYSAGVLLVGLILFEDRDLA